jgi:hypothetical protein
MQAGTCKHVCAVLCETLNEMDMSGYIMLDFVR